MLKEKFQFGFTYIGILMIIAISGIALAGVGIVWHQQTQRENENELLYIGDQYRKAILSYYENNPTGIKQYPKELKNLETDDRFPDKKMHHLRRLYVDPVTHGKPWGLVQQQGFIIGIYSTSKSVPIKKNGFSSPYEGFSEATNYEDWKFTANPQ